MRIEIKGLLAGLFAAIFVVGASYGVSAVVTAREGGSDSTSRQASSAQMNRNMGRMSQKMEPMNAAMSSASASQLISTGKNLYGQACSSCHGANAQGGYGPNLHGLGLPDTKVASVIKNGVKGKMPAFGGKYDATQQQALVAYVQSLKP